MSHPALTAMYVPLVAFSMTAAYLYIVHVLWPAWRTGSLSVKQHGIVVGMCTAFAADSAENVYYGLGRLSNEFYASLSWNVPHVASLKILILAGSMFAISGYWHAVYGRGVMLALFGWAVVLWGAAYSLLMAFE